MEKLRQMGSQMRLDLQILKHWLKGRLMLMGIRMGLQMQKERQMRLDLQRRKPTRWVRLMQTD